METNERDVKIHGRLPNEPHKPENKYLALNGYGRKNKRREYLKPRNDVKEEIIVDEQGEEKIITKVFIDMPRGKSTAMRKRITPYVDVLSTLQEWFDIMQRRRNNNNMIDKGKFGKVVDLEDIDKTLLEAKAKLEQLAHSAAVGKEWVALSDIREKQDAQIKAGELIWIGQGAPMEEFKEGDTLPIAKDTGKKDWR